MHACVGLGHGSSVRAIAILKLSVLATRAGVFGSAEICSANSGVRRDACLGAMLSACCNQGASS